MTSFRVGHGVDVHALAAGRRLVLAGVEIPSERGLVGHSDGDCALHALCDALLGAAAAGDLGDHFPSSDPRWRVASSQVSPAAAPTAPSRAAARAETTTDEWAPTFSRADCSAPLSMSETAG